MNVSRAFTQAQWRFANERAAALPESSATQRLRLALALLYATGLRISALVHSTNAENNFLEQSQTAFCT